MPRPSDPIRRDSLPPAIAATLRKTVRRIRAILWARGLLATAAAALGSILILVAVDAAFPIYSTVARWCLTSAGLASTLLVAWRALARPLSRPFTPARTAAILEARHPELEERISTVVELLDSPDAARAAALGLVKEVGHFAGQLRESGGRAQPPRAPRTPRRSDDDWFRIRGSAKSGAAGTDANVPDEYRELVRDYFRALSEGGE